MATASFQVGTKGNGKAVVKAGTWNFEVDYNDHFETPLVAYQELLPALQALQEGLHITDKSSCKIYDPYFCQGRMVEYMRSFGYENVLNFNRDFYHDVHRKTVPEHDILVTNPPYSGEHKTKLLDFLSKNKAPNSQFRPFALLLPVYIATKSYWRSFVETSLEKHGLQAMYILPARYYEYDHPENTGKDIPPFYSAWLLGNLTPDMVTKIQTAYANFQAPTSIIHNTSASFSTQQHLRPLRFTQLTVCTDVQTLLQLGLVTEKRPNPKQRLKQKHQKQQYGANNDISNTLAYNTAHNKTSNEDKETNHKKLKRQFESVNEQSKDEATTDKVHNTSEKPKSTRHSKKKKRLKAILAGEGSKAGITACEGDIPKKKKRRF